MTGAYAWFGEQYQRDAARWPSPALMPPAAS